jgi:hypothetical protein
MGNLVAIIQLVPALINLIKAAEEAIPGSGKGKAKMDMVVGILQHSYEGINAILPSLQNIITVIVNTFNATGVFKK